MTHQINIIAAVIRKTRGIGKGGKIPWLISRDMSHFARITKEIRHDLKGYPGADRSLYRNACAMGRKTWESIEEKYRPLPGRLNIVVTSNKDYKVPEGVLVAESFEAAVDAALSDATVADIFICGGTRLYQDALDSNRVRYIFMTELENCDNIECDTFFPEWDQLKYIETHFVDREGIPDPLAREKFDVAGIKFRFRRLECRPNRLGVDREERFLEENPGYKPSYKIVIRERPQRLEDVLEPEGSNVATSYFGYVPPAKKRLDWISGQTVNTNWEKKQEPSSSSALPDGQSGRATTATAVGLNIDQLEPGDLEEYKGRLLRQGGDDKEQSQRTTLLPEEIGHHLLLHGKEGSSVVIEPRRFENLVKRDPRDDATDLGTEDIRLATEEEDEGPKHGSALDDQDEVCFVAIEEFPIARMTPEESAAFAREVDAIAAAKKAEAEVVDRSKMKPGVAYMDKDSGFVRYENEAYE